MHVGVVGINHKLADLRLRELLAKACEKRFGLGNWCHGEHAFVLLSTCNRTEVYFSSPDLPETHSYFLNVLREEVKEEFEQKLYSYFGSDCFLHITRVTAGLDSALVGETEIQGQVKAAYETAKAHSTLPSELHFLFQKSLKIAKEVRSKMPLGRGMPDVSQAIWKAGKELFLEPKAAKVLFIGASDINRTICKFLKNKGIENISICNRSSATGQVFSQEHDIKQLAWENLAQWHHFDWVIFGTKCPYYLISQPCANLNSKAAPKLVIDLSVPRNVDPNIGKNSGLTLLNIDQLHRAVQRNRHLLHHTLLLAEMLITNEISKQTDLHAVNTRIMTAS